MQDGISSSSTNPLPPPSTSQQPPSQQFSLCAPPSSPARIRQAQTHNFSLDSSMMYHQYLNDRRRSFRFRGSLGPTIASAPSVEQEEYRTPRPSVSDNQNGKSFDYGAGQHAINASDTNGLVMVSADFLRLNGSRQQFKNLLSARKKTGSMPPAYTRIDCSRESLDSTPANRMLPVHQGPVITVEDTGSQLRFSHQKPSVASSTINDSNKSSLDRGQLLPPEAGHLSRDATLKRNNSRYAVPVDGSQVKMVYRIRSERLNQRVSITDRALLFAMIGVILAVLDAEIAGHKLFYTVSNRLNSHRKDAQYSEKEPVPLAYQYGTISIIMKTLIMLSTICLLSQILLYHINEIKLDLVDCGAEDFRVVITFDRISHFLTEFIICCICPVPGTGNMSWTFMGSNRLNLYPKDAQYSEKEVPVDVLLSLLMLARIYLVGRFMVLHSKQFQDASTRTLAALNRIQVNFSFVMKTLLDQQPVIFLTAFTLIFWVTTAWTFMQCERYGRDEDSPSILFSNAMWFIAITFMLNGYGDIVPQTHAGRVIAIFVGVCGALISSILIAVISRKILLSQGQRNVNNFMNDSRLMRDYKNAAARVLQHTWRIHKCLKGGGNNNNGNGTLALSSDGMLRHHQRRFLHAIHEFRYIKNEIRIFNESNSSSSQQVTRLVTEMHTSMQRLVTTQDEMRNQLEVLQKAMRYHVAPSGSILRDDSPPIVKRTDSTATDDVFTAGHAMGTTIGRFRRAYTTGDYRS